MVGMLIQAVACHLEIRYPATSRSQRGMTTMAAPAASAPCITTTRPVMWNIGTTASSTDSEWVPIQRLLAMALCIRLPWRWMQPLGSPVVPLV